LFDLYNYVGMLVIHTTWSIHILL